VFKTLYDRIEWIYCGSKQPEVDVNIASMDRNHLGVIAEDFEKRIKRP
jgi:hypothetical protein